MGRHSQDEIKIEVVAGGANVMLLAGNEFSYSVSLLPGMRERMKTGEVGPDGDGRTEWGFFVEYGPHLDALAKWVKSHPGHYDYANN